jgi:hypothetical protein
MHIGNLYLFTLYVHLLVYLIKVDLYSENCSQTRFPASSLFLKKGKREESTPGHPNDNDGFVPCKELLLEQTL